VIAEAIAGDEDDFAKLMTRKARALGMSRTVYRNASGLPDDDQVTTARDQSTLGRAIQDRFPRYYRYFSTTEFSYHGHSISNHNHLLGTVEGVDGIKTGYTRASGFNLVTSMRRSNRHLVGVVMGGRSGGSRDAIMRSLLAENLEKASTRRTVAAITERNPADANADVAEAEAETQPAPMVQVQGAVQPAPVEPAAPPPVHSAAPVLRTVASAASGSYAAATGQIRDQVRGQVRCQVRARGADQRRDSNPVDRGDPGFLRTDEARQGEDRPDQGRTGQAGLGRFSPACHARHQFDIGAPGSAGDIERGRGQGRDRQA
jgi:D-alanyl-D-alanine carboxypeptidase